ncbi:TPA: GNAT family N-acetyltransferase, partial [Campylobacter coli]|nr:GNAT family N-acetyltransferase [Campylobacter coli]
ILFFDHIKQAEKKDCQECYDFFKVFFDTNYLFLANPKNLEILNKNILVYKEQGVISGALFYTQSFQTAFLDFIAVKQGLKYKNIAFALLNHYFSINKENKFFKLFVEEKNEKAINFYKKAGFVFNGISLEFYKKF